MSNDRKPQTDPQLNQQQPDMSQVQGEGDYKAAAEFQAEQHAFAQDEAKVEEAAREAADAVDGAEKAELEEAEAAARDGQSV